MTDKAERLKLARERAGYGTAKDAADSMGVPVATYSQHENSIRGFSASKAERYARFFRVRPDWLLYGVQSSNRSANTPRELPSEAVLTSTFALLLDTIGIDPNTSERAQRLAKLFPSALRVIEDLRFQTLESPTLKDSQAPSSAKPKPPKN